jgi:hypothetical protein
MMALELLTQVVDYLAKSKIKKSKTGYLSESSGESSLADSSTPQNLELQSQYDC